MVPELKSRDNKDINVFSWINKDINIKINLFLE
jgi:hypothetical protein